ncbi:MAG: 5-formyltetrahydrofolate cyclo-ligase [Alphaproteobacteria bacterium]|nr:5-formyltetrahydrofolate cyclo-ligase [Alphaproteobacteria bacterium]
MAFLENGGSADKDVFRAEASRRRQHVAAQANAGGAPVALAENCAALFDFGRFPVIAGYWPIGSEIDIRPLLARCADSGAELCLPTVVAKGAPLDFRRWTPGAPLVKDGFGTSAPPSDAGPATPILIFAPLLAFDRDGYRMGYGGGFYDRTIAAYRDRGAPLTVVGCAFAGQEAARVPRDQWDQRLDFVATESEVIAL